MDGADTKEMPGDRPRVESGGYFRETLRPHKEFVLQAFLQLVVHLLGLGVLVAFYYNFCVLDRYLIALFWACICSIPMCQIKEQIILFGQETLRRLTMPRNRGHIPTQDWLDTFRPYESFVNFFFWRVFSDSSRLLGRLLQKLGMFFVRPLRDLINSEQFGSRPYFGLLIRLCVLHFLYKFALENCAFVAIAVVCLYVASIVLRLGFLTLMRLAPYVAPLIRKVALQVALRFVSANTFESLRTLLPKLCDALRMCWKKVHSQLQNMWTMFLRVLEDNVHFILSILIIAVSILACFHVFTILCMSLKLEALIIWETLYKLLHSHPLYETAVSQIMTLVQTARVHAGWTAAGVQRNSTGASAASDHGTVASLWKLGQSVMESTVPEYQEFLQQGVPDLTDFMVLKHVLYDMWQAEPVLPQKNSGLEYVASLASFVSRSPADAEMCADAIAAGAACEASPNAASSSAVPLQQRLNKTTSLLRQLAQGNVSNVMSLGRDAYKEIAATSSFLGWDRSSEGDGKSRFLMLGGTWLARLTLQGALNFVEILTLASSMLGQAVVFLTALFYLLAARLSCLEHIGELLTVIDQSQVIYQISDRVVRAVLLSALKMSAFHALFTWLLYSWGEVPVVVVPTVLSALVALIPVVSPVWSISVWAAVYLWVQNHKFSAFGCFALNVGVWWQVPTVIYAEIPESNPWLTGLSVVLGISHFGVPGVVLGPLIASVPLICLNLLHRFNDTHQDVSPTSSRSRSVSIWNLQLNPVSSPRDEASFAKKPETLRESIFKAGVPQDLDSAEARNPVEVTSEQWSGVEDVLHSEEKFASADSGMFASINSSSQGFQSLQIPSIRKRSRSWPPRSVAATTSDPVPSRWTPSTPSPQPSHSLLSPPRREILIADMDSSPEVTRLSRRARRRARGHGAAALPQD